MILIPGLTNISHRWAMAAALRGSHWLRRCPGGRRPVNAVRRWRLKRLSQKTGRPLSRYELDQLVLLATAHTVIAGPFAGMRYVAHAHGSVLAAKLLGTYERELHGWLQKIIGTPYRTVLDAGCAEGYYAVGLARRMRRVSVHAFDCDPSARADVVRLARLNNVQDRVVVHGEFTTSWLADHCQPPALLFCDVEGDELRLLDPVVMPSLKHCDILVEVHDTPPSTACRDVLYQRFATTHTIEQRTYRTRGLDEVYRWPTALETESVRRAALDEVRTRGTRWMFLRAHRQEISNYHDG